MPPIELSTGMPSMMKSGWLLDESEFSPRMTIREEPPCGPELRDVHAGDLTGEGVHQVRLDARELVAAELLRRDRELARLTLHPERGNRHAGDPKRVLARA